MRSVTTSEAATIYHALHNNATVVIQALWVKITLQDHPRLEAPAIKGLFLQSVRIVHNNAAVAQ